MNLFISITFVLLAYLVGSIPFAYLFTKWATGKNIMKEGSGNVGSTNVKRVAGKKISLLTQIFDIFKGGLPVAMYLYFSHNYNTDCVIAMPEHYVYALALAAIVGHDFSIFLKFKGGKGVNTTLGASLLISPIPVFISVSVYLFLRLKFKYVSLASMGLAIALPIGEFLIYQESLTFFYFLVCMVLILLFHLGNIKRLLEGREFEV